MVSRNSETLTELFIYFCLYSACFRIKGKIKLKIVNREKDRKERVVWKKRKQTGPGKRHEIGR